MNVCTQMALRYFTAKLKFLKLHPNSYFEFFYNEIQYFVKCTLTAIPFLFLSKMQNFKTSTLTALWISRKEIQNLTIYDQFSFVS